MGTVTISIPKKTQNKLDFIRLHVPALKEFSGDILTKKFISMSIDAAAEQVGYTEQTHEPMPDVPR